MMDPVCIIEGPHDGKFKTQPPHRIAQKAIGVIRHDGTMGPAGGGKRRPQLMYSRTPAETLLNLNAQMTYAGFRM
jgi:hypothetical protein